MVASPTNRAIRGLDLGCGCETCCGVFAAGGGGDGLRLVRRVEALDAEYYALSDSILENTFSIGRINSTFEDAEASSEGLDALWESGEAEALFGEAEELAEQILQDQERLDQVYFEGADRGCEGY